MRFPPHVWLLLSLAGCGSITPFAADADATVAAPGPARRGPTGSGSSALDAGAPRDAPMTNAPPAGCDKSRSNGNDQGMGEGGGGLGCPKVVAPDDRGDRS